MLTLVVSFDETLHYYSTLQSSRVIMQAFFDEVTLMCRNNIGHKTNHSVRATGAMELYHGNVPEKFIQYRTGHQSLKADHEAVP